MKLAAGCCFLIAAVVGVCNAAPAKGKVFDHILQIWFENQVIYLPFPPFG